MAREVSVMIGSGTLPFTRQILPSSQRGNQQGSEGIRHGTQVVIANPEDLNSFDAFATSGVSIGTTPIKIWDANINYLLPRESFVELHNDGPSPAYIGPNSTSVISPSGWLLTATGGSNQRTKLPFLKNVEIWGRSDGTSSIRILVY